MHTDTTCDMYPTDDAAHAAAMRHFGEDAPARLPALYPTDHAAHEAALHHFEGNHHDE